LAHDSPDLHQREFGGCDIVTEMYQRGELKTLVEAALK
jgi:glutaredoxin-related protein